EPPVAARAAKEGTAPQRAVQVLPLSAGSQTALRELATDVAALLERPDASLGDVAHTARVGRAPLRERVVVAASGAREAAAALQAWVGGEETAGVYAGRVAPEPPSVAFLYTGQGSQRPGMARDLYGEEPVVRELLDR